MFRNALENTELSASDVTREALQKADLRSLTHQAELRLMRQLSTLPRILESAAQFHEPHRIAIYLNELAADFHSLWNLGKEEESLKFIQADKNATLDRLAMIEPLLLRLSRGLIFLVLNQKRKCAKCRKHLEMMILMILKASLMRTHQTI